MKKLIIIILIVVVGGTIYGQTEPFFSAGPDITICGGNGKEIGHPTVAPLSKYCYRWEPAEGLSNPDDAKPIAKPEKTTTYTLTVLSENWDLIGTDQVTVLVGWGGIKFDPTFLEQSGTSMVTPTLQINEIGGLPRWTIEGPDLACQMPNHGTGVITDGNKFGTITVRCEDINQPTGECYAEEKLDINPGVKDVWAIDGNNPKRIAKNGETLVIIDNLDAEIRAIPNEGGFKGATNPKWYPALSGFTNRPPDGTKRHFTSDPLDEQFVLGPSPDHMPLVNVDREGLVPINIAIAPIINNMDAVMAKLNEKLKKILSKAGFNLEFSASAGPTVYKRSNAELFENPGKGTKQEFELSIGVDGGGEICHPTITKTIEFFGTQYFSSRLCAVAGFSVDLQGSAEKDPSKAAVPEWKINNELKVVGGLNLGIEGGISIAIGAGYHAYGEVGATANVELEIVFQADGVTNGQFKLKPLVLPISFGVYNETDPMEREEYFSSSYPIVPEWVSPQFLIYDF